MGSWTLLSDAEKLNSTHSIRSHCLWNKSTQSHNFFLTFSSHTHTHLANSNQPFLIFCSCCWGREQTCPRQPKWKCKIGLGKERCVCGWGSGDRWNHKAAGARNKGSTDWQTWNSCMTKGEESKQWWKFICGGSFSSWMDNTGSHSELPLLYKHPLLSKL